MEFLCYFAKNLLITSNRVLKHSNAPQAAADCQNPPNDIVAENCQTGNSPSEWEVVGAGDASIQGFATDISVDQGGTINFKIDTTSTDYRIDIYRLNSETGHASFSLFNFLLY